VRRPVHQLAIVVGVVAAGGWLGYSSAGSSSAATPRTLPTTDAKWHSARPALWHHGEPANDLDFGPATTVNCMGSTCYVVVQANGIEPGGAAVNPASASLGSSAYRSEDHGVRWTPLTLPPQTWLSSPFACSGSSKCVVGAIIGAAPGATPGESGTAVVLATSDGGRHWTEHDLPSWVGLVTDLACSSALHCVALIGGREGTTIDGMESYSGANRFYPTSILTTNYRGRTWSKSTVPSVSSDIRDYLSSVICSSTSQCFVLGEQARIVADDGGYVEANPTLVILSSHDGGHRLTTSYHGSTLWPESMACAAATECLVLAESVTSPVVITTNNGRT
jgi:hypothetical protein